MTTHTRVHAETDTLASHGLAPKRVWANLTPSRLGEHAVLRNGGQWSDTSAFPAVTGAATDRSTKDKFVVEEPGSSGEIWWGRNEKLSEAHFTKLLAAVKSHLNEQPELFVQDLFGGADPAYRVPVRFITPNAWHALFVRNMFVRPTLADLAQFQPEWSVYHAPELEADPALHQAARRGQESPERGARA